MKHLLWLSLAVFIPQTALALPPLVYSASGCTAALLEADAEREGEAYCDPTGVDSVDCGTATSGSGQNCKNGTKGYKATCKITCNEDDEDKVEAEVLEYLDIFLEE